MSQNHIAVIGIGCHYPGAKDLKVLWENILARRRQFRKMPDERLPLGEYYDPNPDAPDKTYARYAALIDDFTFDWVKNRIPKSAYESSDIVHWLALEVATQALIDAGYSKENIPKTKTGVILGNSLTGEFTRSDILRLRWPFVRKTLRAAGQSQGLSELVIDQLEKYMESIYKSVFPPVTEDSLAGWLSNTIAGRICNFYDLHGGGYVVDGACSSSLLAVATAASKLANGELDLALAGGVDISLDPMEIVGFAKAGALTNKDMNVYDRLSSGFIPGEGSGFIVLKRLEDARRDGDYVYAVIRGWGISSDGKGGITAPKAEGQALALQRAYEMAGYSPHELDFVEGHGTGTVVGDRVELEGISLAREAFGEVDARSCGVTSIKSLIGHTKAAAGIAGFIKAVLSVNQRVLVPTAACKNPNDIFYTKAKSIYPILQGEICSPNRHLRAGVSAMGFGGINCHVTLESADLPKEELKPELEERALLVSNQETECFIFAAETKEELLTQVKRIYHMSSGISIAEMADLGFHLAQTLNSKAKIRAAIIADHPDRLSERLQLLIQKIESNFPLEREVSVDLENLIFVGNQVNKHRVGFLFPGQGSQKINMARTLIERFPWAREIADQLWGLLPQGKELMFRPLEKALNQEEVKEWEKQLSQTEIAQPTISLASVLWTKFLHQLGIIPEVTAGHSLGELAALYAAGAYDEKTLFQLATLRGEAMSASEEEAGTMASLRCDRSEAEKILRDVSGYVVIANLNSPLQTVISGEKEAINQAVQIAQDQGIQAIMLPVSNAFHSELVSKASNILREKAPLSTDEVNLTIPFVSGISGEKLETLSDAKEYFAKQVIQQVDFISLVSTLQLSCDLLVEVGPGRVLTGLISSNLQNEIPCFPVESSPEAYSDLQRFLATYFIHGGQVEWEVLYENRLIRPFIPVSERNFIVNPCERPLSIPDSIPESNTFKLNLTEELDLPAEVLDQYLEQRSSFILDVIRSDLKHMSSFSAVAATKESTLESRSIAKTEKAVEPTKSSVEETVLQLVAERTGYPEELISLHHLLLDDLNLDSIKSAELVSAIAKSFHVEDQVDPSEFANAKLQDIIDEVKRLLPELTTSPTSLQNVEAVQNQETIAEMLIQQVEKITGYPRESIHFEMRLLDDLNLDSIKSAELVSAVAKSLHIEDRIDPSGFANAKLQDIIDEVKGLLPELTTSPTSLQNIEAVPNHKSIAEMLIQQVEKITGYPRESIHFEMRLLDDLNLDSIKSAELISKVAKEFQLQDKVDPSLFANATLKEIEQALSPLLDHHIDKPKKNVKRQSDLTSNWVRDFVIDYVEKPIDFKPIEFPKSSRFLIVTEQVNNALAQAIIEELEHHQIPRCTTTFAKLRSKELLQNESFSHIIAILPKTVTRDEITEMVKRLHCVVRPVKEIGYKASITFIQYGGGTFGTKLDQIQLSTCTANAFASSLHMERPHAKIRVIDLSPSLKAKNIVNNILAEIASEDSFLSVGYDKHNVRRVSQAIVQQPSKYPSRSIEWTEDDVILVVGGAKGITAECALALAKTINVKMALVGNSSIDNKEIQQNLARWEQAGVIYKYYQCDITNREKVKHLIQSVTEELGQITGVIHGAGLVRSKRAEQISLTSFLEEIGPKVFGALNLCEELKDQPPKLFIGFSSLTGLVGMEGNTTYGFANEALQLILRRFEKQHPETQVLSIAYGIWDQVGMGVRSGSIEFLKKKGINPISVSEGVARFVHLFHHEPPDKQVVVTAKLDGLDTWNPQPVKPAKKFRYIDEILYEYPEVELVTRVHLDLEKDSYVKDHVFNGTYLFPAVFGLEAMAQAVSYITGIEDFSRVCIEDIQFKLPIVLDPQKGVTIEIRAEVLEDNRVVTEIRTEQTSFTKTHFKASFVLPEESEVAIKEEPIYFPEEALAIKPKEDLYGPLLFQGPAYQRLEQVFGIVYNPEINIGGCLLTVREETKEDFCLGDPYYHDALLQSVQLITPQDICLPVKIASFEKFGIHQNINATWRVVVRLKEKEGDYYTYSVNILDENNQIIQSLTDYKVHIMEHKPERPTVEEIVSLAFIDERKLTKEIETQGKLLQVDIPTITLAHLPGIHQQNREKRHQQVLPLFQRALAKSGATGDYSLTWEENGKPRILTEGNQTADFDTSFSHDDEVTICVVGNKKQGCDILPIENHRSEEDWMNLLTSKYQPLIQLLIQQGDSIDVAGSRIWACLEAVKKASGEKIQSIELKKVLHDSILLDVNTEKSTYTVLSIPIQLSKPTKRMVAIVASSQQIRDQIVYDEFHPEYGFIHRFALTHPVTFTLGRTVDISSYSTWVGKLRELALTTVRRRVRKQFATGKWGMVTNFLHTEVFGEARSHDVVEAHVQVERIENDNYLEMVYYFYKVKETRGLELIAISRQGLTWVEIDGQSSGRTVRKVPFPDYFKQYVEDKFTGIHHDNSLSAQQATTLSEKLLGEELFEVHPNPSKRIILQQSTFETFMEESDLVGNIFFSNYAIWQRKLCDQFFYKLAPELYRGAEYKGEWLALNSYVKHLREAVPFDKIEVQMSFAKQYEHGVKLYFEYYRLDSEGQKQKLAFGEQDLAWVKRDEKGNLVSASIPETFTKKFTI